MCGSMADIQSAAAEIRRGKKKKEEEERRTNHSMKIYMVYLFHRATIIIIIIQYLYSALKSCKGYRGAEDGDGGGGHCLVQMEWHPAGWLM